MKPVNYLIVVSLGLNIAMTIALMRSSRSAILAGRLEARTEKSTREPEAVANPISAATGAPGTLGKEDSPRPGSDLWNRLYTENLDEFATRLRKAGFPLAAVQMMVSDVAVQKSMAARLRIVGAREETPYWKAIVYSGDLPDLQARLAELAKEEAQVFRKNFSSREALEEQPEMAATVRQRFGDLPLEKLAQLWQIEGDYNELSQEVYRAASAGRTSPDGGKLATIEAEKRRDLQLALTPEEFEQYELRSSPTAFRLRSQLETFRPSESEYKALFALQHSVDEQFSNRFNNEQASQNYSAAAEALKPQIEATLGHDRYLDYVQAMEGGSNNLNRLMVRLDLPLATVGKIDAIRQDIAQRADTIRADEQLQVVDRNSRLAELAQEAQARLTRTLGGARGYSAYEDMKGDWIRALAKPATR